MDKKVSQPDMSKQIEQITSRLNKLEKKRESDKLAADCSHHYLTIEIEKSDGWISGSAKCIYCDKVFYRKGSGRYLSKRMMRKLRKLYNSFK